MAIRNHMTSRPKGNEGKLEPVERHRLELKIREYERRLRQGYTKVSFGGGDSFSDQGVEKRIVSLAVFYHPINKRVSTQQSLKVDAGHGEETAGIVDHEYTYQEFTLYCKACKIRVGENKLDLIRLIGKYRKNLK